MRKLKLHNFRNYKQLELRFSATGNFFCGPNAQGKSNLLEAIYCLSLTRGFRTYADQELLKFGTDSFEVTGEYLDERGTEHVVIIYYQRVSGAKSHSDKQISLDRKRLPSHAALLGKIPLVLFSPESHRVTAGPPMERRRFMDVLLSQGSSSYLADLQEYNRILRQRNALLTQLHSGARRQDPQENRGTNNADRMLTAWDESLALYGCKIIQARYCFVQNSVDFLQQAYEQISASSHSLQFAYRSHFDMLAGEPEAINPQCFLERLGEYRGREKQRGQTLMGPHRDDLELTINGIDLRRFGSRGEHKSVLMALKMLEVEYLKRKLDTAPIILLDDLISELDETRSRQCVENFTGRGQLFVSAVSLHNELSLPDAAKFQIQNGNVTLNN